MTLKLPVIVVTISNIYKEQNRVHSVNDALYHSTSETLNPIYNVAVPMNILFDVEYITKYQDDADQIFCNIAASFNPDVYVVWKNPYTGESIKSQIYWDGITEVDYSTAIKNDQPYRIASKTSFTFRTWLFPGNANQDDLDSKLIAKINVNDYGDGLDSFYDVPYSMDLDDYLENVQNGLIDYPNYDTVTVPE